MSMNSMFNNMFGKIQNGMCRLSMDGLIAIDCIFLKKRSCCKERWRC